MIPYIRPGKHPRQVLLLRVIGVVYLAGAKILKTVRHAQA